MKRILVLALAGVAALLAGGCTTISTTSTGGARPVQMVRAEGLTVGDLLVSLNSNKPQSEIIAEIKSKGLRSTLSAADIDVLTQNGASKEMVDALAVAGQQFPTTVATGPAVTTTSTYYSGYGWWPWAGFSYWSGYPYGYAYGGHYGGGYYSRGPVYRGPVYGGPVFRGPAIVSPPGVPRADILAATRAAADSAAFLARASGGVRSRSAARAMLTPSDEQRERVFAEPWEAKAFAIVVQMAEAGYFTWAEWVDCFSREVAAATAIELGGGKAKTYYEQWLSAAETLMIDKGITSAAQLAAKKFAIGAVGTAHVLK